MKLSTVVRSIAWSGLESLGVSILLIFTVIIMARILGPLDFGVATLALGLVYIPLIIAERLFHDAIIQRKELTTLHLDTTFCVSIGIAILLVLGIWTISPVVAKFYNEPRLSTALQLSSLSLLFNAPSGILIADLRRKMQFKPLALRNMVATLIGAMVGLIMAINGFGLLSLICQQIVQSFIGMIIIFASVDQFPRLRFSSVHLKDLIGFSTLAIVSETIRNSQFRLFIVVLGYYSGLTTVGYFEIASRVVGSLIFFWQNAINSVAMSAFSKLQSNKFEFKKAFRQITEINASLIVPVFAGLFVITPEMVMTLLDKPWVASTPIIQLMSIGALFSSIRQFSPVVFNSLGRPQYNLIEALPGLMIPALVLLVLMPTTLIAQGTIWVGRLVITIPISFWLTYKILAMSPLEQIKGVGSPLVASLIMVYILWITKTTLLFNMADSISLMCQIFLGFLIYPSFLILFSPHLIKRFSRIIKEIKGNS